MRLAKERPLPPPWEIPLAELNARTSELAALRAIAQGLADEHQQRRGFEFICRFLCAEKRRTFFPGGEDGRRASDFAEGRRFVATQLRRIVELEPVTVDSRGEPPPMPAAKPEVSDA